MTCHRVSMNFEEGSQARGSRIYVVLSTLSMTKLWKAFGQNQKSGGYVFFHEQLSHHSMRMERYQNPIEKATKLTLRQE